MTQIFHFDDDNEAARLIIERFDRELPHDLSVALAAQLVVYFGARESCLGEWAHSPESSGAIDIGAPFLGPYTIRESDLLDIKDICRGGAILLFKQTETSAVVSLIVSAACMLWRLRRRGVSVNPLQCAVLFSLRRAGELPLDGLVDDVRRASVDWKEADVMEALKELSAIRLNDGTVVPLVHADHSERWSTDARGLWEVNFGSF